MRERTQSSPLAVAITTFQSEDVITDCLQSLLECRDDIAKVVVVDNASHDRTREVIREWASAHSAQVSFSERAVGETGDPAAWLTLLNSPVNAGFAYATNRGLEALLADPEISLFWVLNPDCKVLPETPRHYIEKGADQNFSLMGGRTLFEHQADTIQTDGGTVSLVTGVCGSVNSGKAAAQTPLPKAGELDFITGANCVASRLFLETKGLMEEDYFLYYEEVDWAFRRGDLPLRVADEAAVRHHGGTSIGTGSVFRRPTPFANYFNYRNRIRFLRRHKPAGVVPAFLYALAKSVQLFLIGAPGEARAVLAGLLGARPPAEVAARLSPEARSLAFGPAQAAQARRS